MERRIKAFGSWFRLEFFLGVQVFWDESFTGLGSLLSAELREVVSRSDLKETRVDFSFSRLCKVILGMGTDRNGNFHQIWL